MVRLIKLFFILKIVFICIACSDEPIITEPTNKDLIIGEWTLWKFVQGQKIDTIINQSWEFKANGFYKTNDEDWLNEGWYEINKDTLEMYLINIDTVCSKFIIQDLNIDEMKLKQFNITYYFKR